MDKIIKKLNPKENKFLLFGGVYSNLQALEALKNIADKQNITAENCICTGDVVGYCAQPEETVQFFKQWGALSIRGNVETQLIEEAEDCGCDFTKGSRCDGFSAVWYPYAQKKISKDSLDYINSFPNHYEFNIHQHKITVVHGSYFQESEFIFKSTTWEIKTENFTSTDSDIIIAGHCGLPFYDTKNNHHWINPGVIGMPANDGNTNVWYAILEVINGEIIITHHQLKYDYLKASKLMTQNNLPQAYANTLQTGIWDNTEILPQKETQAQAQKIILDSINLSLHYQTETNQNE